MSTVVQKGPDVVAVAVVHGGEHWKRKREKKVERDWKWGENERDADWSRIDT